MIQSNITQALSQEENTRNPIPSPNYYAIIPAHVRYCKDLEPMARLLYGELTALAHKEGYCWASNEYFANLYGVDIRTVQFWLASLVKQGFIKVEVIKEGMKTSRKIWISVEIQKMFTTRKKFHGRHEKNATHNIKYINTKEEKEIGIKEKEPPPDPQRGSPLVSFLSFGKFVKLTQPVFDKLCEVFGKDKVEGTIEEMNDYLSALGRKPYKDFAAAIRNWIRRDNKKSQNFNNKGVMEDSPSVKINKKVAHEIQDFLVKRNEFDSLKIYKTGVSAPRSKEFRNEFIKFEINPETFKMLMLKYLNMEEKPDDV